MDVLKGACIFGQSGGPTSVINASAAGVFQEALAQDCITGVYVAAHGIKGLLDDVIYDVSKEDPNELNYLLTTPSSAFGSVRYKLKHFDEDETDYEKILNVFKKYNIRYFFYNGGNDSMDTCSKISSYLTGKGYECRVIGVPKTIDNDLWGTDHCPGYGSAAKYLATSIMEVHQDSRVYDSGMAIIFEVMGRNAGWLTAATSLASYKGMGPDLIYLPELDFDIEEFTADVDRIYSSTGHIMVAVSEGIKNSKGVYFAEMTTPELSTDSFGHVQLGGAAGYLANYLKSKFNSMKIRAIEFSLLQRCAAHCASRTDIDEAYMTGKMAVKYALEGNSGYMVAFEREHDPDYLCRTKLVDLADVANKEKKVPMEWINVKEHGMNSQFIDYVKPLIVGETVFPTEDGLPRFARIKRVRA